MNNISDMFPKAHDRIIKELFNSKCAHLYGCETWDQSDPSICRVYTAWNRGVIKSDEKHVCLHNGLTEHDKRTVAMIMEIRDVLNGDSVSGIDNKEVTDILHSLCCD